MSKIKEIMEIFLSSGYQCYRVGGAVRDMLMGTIPNDIDLATDATPEEILVLAKENNIKTREVGAAFGVILWNGIEIATFRSDSYGQDAHRPDAVKFEKSLLKDLARRDFTINAMAMTISGEIIDPFNGQEDISGGIVRAVGDPNIRFAEDALRMFRACRFVSQLGFSLEPETFNGIKKNTDKTKGLSVERVADELEKLLQGKSVAKALKIAQEAGLLDAVCTSRDNGNTKQIGVLPELEHLVGLAQNPAHHAHDVWEHTLKVVKNAPPELRWAALLHDIGKGKEEVRSEKNGLPTDHGHAKVGAEIAEKALTRLRLPTQVIKETTWLVRRHMDNLRGKRWVKKAAAVFNNKKELTRAVKNLLSLREADIRGQGKNTSEKLAELFVVKGLLAAELAKPYYPSELAINGREIANIFGESPLVGKIIDDFLIRVRREQLKNTPEELLQAVLKKKKRLEGQI